MGTASINIDMDAKCKGCGKGGACQNGYCLACNSKRIAEHLRKTWPENDPRRQVVVEHMAGMMAGQAASLIWENAAEIGMGLEKERAKSDVSPPGGELTVKMEFDLYLGRKVNVKSRISFELKQKFVKESGLESYDPDQPELPGILEGGKPSGTGESIDEAINRKCVTENERLAALVENWLQTEYTLETITPDALVSIFGGEGMDDVRALSVLALLAKRGVVAHFARQDGRREVLIPTPGDGEERDEKQEPPAEPAEPRFYGKSYIYPTPNNGDRVIGVVKGLGNLFIVAWEKDNGSLKRVTCKHMAPNPNPEALQRHLDGFAVDRGLITVTMGDVVSGLKS